MRKEVEMIKIVDYKSKDPYYSDVRQTYIGLDEEEIERIREETEEFMFLHNPSYEVIEHEATSLTTQSY